MFAHLPSLNGLRVFEAAARHLSFKLAAKELELTPTAVSHQIRNLETQLNLSLFIRHTRAVELTLAGQTLFDSCQRVLRQLDQTLGQLGVGNQSLSICAAPGFAALWLAQRLPYFQRRFPEIEVSVSQSDTPAAKEADIIISRAAGRESSGSESPGSDSQSAGAILLGETLGVFASPAYLQRKHSQQTLMHVRRHGPATAQIGIQACWDEWQQLHGKFREPQLIEFDREDQLLQACLAGQGLALTSSLLVSAQVEQGWLKPCLPEKVLPGAGYSVTVAEGARDQQRVKHFIDWLKEQAGSHLLG
ncbi:LysR family transcriptional regulator [Shewanella sp. JM162201]|uniref:LysR family transcriptional regulator n=1 Tax=Shewanella jiangmenensis TaxID=2837387 RepID=A0ABS5V3X0_9GAMM|nr:LysR family transcriptional regulator [Shewanella jiangmenensis]MBT1445146.1 LysR family transcriptional regulator [Shewanella jiangmenensis]